ncbi:hypothetical protein P8H27_04590 [Pseudomonas sp. sp1636]|uniref:tetratricopeptide repeat protein n=1 Tax=Pseudomonas sp. sp1636 TaxID=3036707 RepID=UPI0025A62B6F|nr:hypothetical protein [Pseudomonas sp. sp1636]MDM8348171.1 hypothetical protein [Pseudomonas sp. sp1636]
MSLVNDMLRDLEQRRAAPGERLRLDGLHAVDETGAARRVHLAWLLRGLWCLAALVLLGLLAVLLGRQLGAAAPLAPVAPAPVVTEPAAAQLLDVLPQHDSRGLVLQLPLSRSVPYRRTEESGAVSLSLTGVQWSGEAQHGRIQRDGRSLSWDVEAKGDAVQVLLVGLGDQLEVRDRLEPAGDRWLLWIEVPLNAPLVQAAAAPEMDDLPLAEPASAGQEAPLPAWVAAPLGAAAEAPRKPAAAAVAANAKAEAEAEADAEAMAERRASRAEVKIAPYQPDALTLARQALLDADHPRAIRLLEELQRQRGDDAEVLRWLARAYLADGQQQRLLSWLPAQLQRLPQDSELRVLLARSQLQAADAKGAVATLEQYAPPLVQEANYYALLAASYQQTGQWQQSAALYRQMIELRPSQATWQLGLAIALEQLDRPGEAANHYRLALQGQGLDDSARRFVGERAAALGGQR